MSVPPPMTGNPEQDRKALEAFKKSEEERRKFMDYMSKRTSTGNPVQPGEIAYGYVPEEKVAPTPMQDKLDKINQQLADLYAQDQSDPATIKAIEEKTKEQQQASAKALTEGQQNLTATAVKTPEQLITPTPVDRIDPNTPGTSIDPRVGDAGPTQNAISAPSFTSAADTPAVLTPATMQATATQGTTEDALKDKRGSQGTVSTTVDAATQDPATLGGRKLDVAQITDPTKVVVPPARTLQEGELIGGSAVDMAAVKEATEIQAAQADPSKSASVKGQLDDLMDDFEDGATPAWAAGAMRAATAAMNARGLGSSSMAGQAIVQAAMESALPIAQQDAQIVAQFEAQNLSNRQQVAMFAAQQRADFLKIDFNQAFQSRVTNAAKISDIANTNFTADQQVALENAKMAQTANLTNLSAKNAKIMADAAAISNMELTNLSNQQQASVENAKNFLQMDLTNLSNDQQTELFKVQALQQSILTDAAADNAAKQFNASSVNQTQEFMATLASQVSQFNTSQANAMEQFAVSETNAIRKFNEEQRNARQQFNTQNGLIIAQANAQWRQNTSTANTAAQNEANMQDAKAANAFTASTLDQVWQRERDLMSYAWKTSETALDRINDVIIANISATASKENAQTTASASDRRGEAEMWGTIGSAILGYKF